MARLRNSLVLAPRLLQLVVSGGLALCPALLGPALCWAVEGDPSAAVLESVLEFDGEALPALPSQAPLVREPLTLADASGRLVGAAWLEGHSERSLAVRFAPWDGAAWGLPEPVAPPGPGSQLALTGAVTMEHSVALAWSGFDGIDDEIQWSLRRGGRWSPPRRLAADNAVPDITPAFLALPGRGRGLLAAWSRYQDGQYRVVLARFDGRRWSEPAPVGPPGSLFPSFEPPLRSGSRSAAGSQPGTLLFRTARPRGWQVLELDATGRPLRSAQMPAATAVRPSLSACQEGVCFEWPELGVRTPAVRTATVRTAPWENLP